jgi:C-terminal processing protease CtpA/Prc
VIKIIQKKGIPHYIEHFNQKYREVIPEFTSENEFLTYMNRIISYYHPHSFLSENVVTKSIPKTLKPTEFSFSDRIGKIKLFSFGSYNGPVKYEEEKKKYIEEIHSFLDLTAKNRIKGLIIDFTRHGGGGIWQTIDAFKRFFDNTTLFAWGNVKVTRQEKKWTNMENGKIVWNRHFLTKKLNSDIPIAIIIGKHTASAGEILAAMFKSSDNVKVFGEKTKGFLSMNGDFSIDKYTLTLTATLQTSKDGSFHEYLEPNVSTHCPISEAKKWIRENA